MPAKRHEAVRELNRAILNPVTRLVVVDDALALPAFGAWVRCSFERARIRQYLRLRAGETRLRPVRRWGTQ